MKNPKNFLVLTGPAGTGKTYFCAAMLVDMVNKASSIRAYNERSLFRQLRASFDGPSSGDYLETLHSMLDDAFIILDDIGSSGHTVWREEVLMEAIDFRYENMLPTLITSNLSKDEFYSTYGQRISSRIFAKENVILSLDELEDYRSLGK